MVVPEAERWGWLAVYDAIIPPFKPYFENSFLPNLWNCIKIKNWVWGFQAFSYIFHEAFNVTVVRTMLDSVIAENQARNMPRVYLATLRFRNELQDTVKETCDGCRCTKHCV